MIRTTANPTAAREHHVQQALRELVEIDRQARGASPWQLNGAWGRRLRKRRALLVSRLAMLGLPSN